MLESVPCAVSRKLIPGVHLLYVISVDWFPYRLFSSLSWHQQAASGCKMCPRLCMHLVVHAEHILVQLDLFLAFNSTLKVKKNPISAPVK